MIYLQISRTAMGGDGDVQNGALDSLFFSGGGEGGDGATAYPEFLQPH